MFDGFIRDKAHWTPRAPAVVTPAGAVAYERLDADVDRIGARLMELGVAPRSGAVVAVSVESAYLELAAIAALARLGLPSAPPADTAADLVLADHETPGALVLGRDVLAAEPRRLPALELDPDTLGRISLTGSGRTDASWRRLEIANFAHLRTWAAGRTATFVPLGGVDHAFGFAQAVCAWSCGGAVAAGFRPADLPAALETLPPGVVGLTPAQLSAALAARPPGFRPQPAWRLVVEGAQLPRTLTREAHSRLTPDIRVVYASAEHGLIAMGHAADDALVPLAGAPVEVTDTREIHVAGVPTGDHGRRTPDGRLILEASGASPET